MISFPLIHNHRNAQTYRDISIFIVHTRLHYIQSIVYLSPTLLLVNCMFRNKDFSFNFKLNQRKICIYL